MGPVRFFTPYRRKKRKEIGDECELEPSRKVSREIKDCDSNDEESCNSDNGMALIIILIILYCIYKHTHYNEASHL